MIPQSIPEAAYTTTFYDQINGFINRTIDKCITKYQEYESSHPRVVAIAKKVIPVVFLILSLILTPIPTLIGYAIGLVLSIPLQPIVDRIKNALFEDIKTSSLFGKLLMGVGGTALCFVTPAVVQGAFVGTSAGLQTGKMVADYFDGQGSKS